MIYVSQRVFDSLVNILSDYDISVNEEYSGRGMYGKTCIGFSFDCNVPYFCYRLQEELLQLLAVYEDDIERGELEDLYHHFLEGAEQDSLGMGTIVYNRRFSIKAEE